MLYAEDFAEMSLIEGRRGLRRRPLWEFEIDTARQQLNLQFGTRDLVGVGVENAPRGLCAAGCLLQDAKDTQRTTLPHIRSITMEREQDSIMMDAATRRNLEITQNLAGQFGTRDLVGFGVENAPRGLCAAGCLLQYAKDTQRTTLPHIRSITMEREQDSISMDAATRRNLEITQNLAGGAENTLASVLDCTVTPMGSRMLKRWLHMPAAYSFHHHGTGAGQHQYGCRDAS